MPLHLIFPEPCRISAHLSAGKAIPYGFFLISRVAESLSKSLFLFRSPSHHTKQIYTAGASSCYFHFPNLLLSLSLLSFVDKHPAFQTKGLKVLKLGYTKGKRIFWGEEMPVEYPPALCRVCSLLLRLFLQLSFVLCACGYSKKGDGKFLGWFLFLCECCCHKTDPSTLWFQSVITCKGIIGIFFHYVHCSVIKTLFWNHYSLLQKSICFFCYKMEICLRNFHDTINHRTELFLPNRTLTESQSAINI